LAKPLQNWSWQLLKHPNSHSAAHEISLPYSQKGDNTDIIFHLIKDFGWYWINPSLCTYMNRAAHNSEEGNTQQPALSNTHKCVAVREVPAGS